MATSDSLVPSQPSERTTKVILPLIGTACALLAAVLSAYVLYFTNDKTVMTLQQLEEIKLKQDQTEQAIRSSQFNRESERQYVALVYADLISKDAVRQAAAISLLEILEPETSLKLLTWAQKTGQILDENKAKTSIAESKLESLQENSRFRIFLHSGTAKNRTVPDFDAIKKVLAVQGFSILGVDNKSDDFGPGVDYFDDGDKTGAQEVAKALGQLSTNNPVAIPVRKQSAAQRAGTLGIWF